MNMALLSAALLTAIACVVHGVAGQLDPLNPMLKTELRAVAKVELAAVWHALTLGFGLAAVVLFSAARNEASATPVLAFLGWQFLVYGVAILGVALWQRNNVFKTPQWILMWLISGLIFWS